MFDIKLLDEYVKPEIYTTVIDEGTDADVSTCCTAVGEATCNNVETMSFNSP